MAGELHGEDLKNADFDKIIRFSVICDQMKSVYRRTMLCDLSRRETDAEHSWHLALMAMLLSDYAPEGTDIAKVIQMVVVHDLVEIYAGDTFCYDEHAALSKKDREKDAADRLFAILPQKIGHSMRSLWEEFDEETTNEAAFAAALDRLQPLLNNFMTDGYTWREGAVERNSVEKRTSLIKKAIPKAAELLDEIMDDSERKGFFTKKE